MGRLIDFFAAKAADRRARKQIVMETERLILRCWKVADAPAMYKYASDPDVGPRSGWLPHRSVSDSRGFIRYLIAETESYAVVLRETEEIIGSIRLKVPKVRLEDLPESAVQLDLAYWLGKPHWGQGYIPEAAQALLRRGFETLGCDVIWCDHYDFNVQSRRVIEKCGFRYQFTKPTTNLTGSTYDTLFYAMTREEWQNHDRILYSHQ